jgi:acetoin utilization deacetylase AcuC-like enzyme
MKTRRLAFLHSPEIEAFTYPPECPFKWERAAKTRRRLLSFGILGGPDQIEVAPRKATLAELARIHTPEYLEELQRAASGHLTVAGLHMGIGGHDTPVFKEMFECASWACGAGLVAADLLLRGEADVAFNLYGGLHHASADHAGGFCYLNDVALACDHLATAGRRTAYVDVDAHHGDGVQSILYRRGDVLKISLHESGRTLFPWGGFEDEIGEGPGRGFNVNIPLPADIYDEAYMRVFNGIAMPILRAFAPDCLVIGLGMDILAGDPLTHLRLTNNVVVDVLKSLLSLDRPMLVAGGGGYHVENTVRGWALAWNTCIGDETTEMHHPVVGGNMLASSDWVGGLRDHSRPVFPEQRSAVDPELRTTCERLQNGLFPLHGIAVAQ